MESGYRCAIPACGVTAPLHLDHIISWEAVRAHEFGNLIVLCANHHGLKESATGPRSLDRKALQSIKHNLALVNGRYGDIERRVIDYFIENPGLCRVTLPGNFEVLLMRLIDDGILNPPQPAGLSMALGDLQLKGADYYDLTDRGDEIVGRIREARSVD